ncbi:hypothetical protein EPO05_06565 [Patescibacteria group bacterium]|nr:MAG: hypothetical protein EPO05_06565 [Patescibacteria group bacterium]
MTTASKPPKHEPLTRAEERALNNLESEGLGGRDILLDKLLHVPDVSPDEERLLSFLTDPEKSRFGLASLCSDAGFSVARFLKFLQRAEGARALVGAITHVHAQGAEVARDAMSLGRIRKFQCAACGGDGEVLDKASSKDAQTMKKCIVCLGIGEIVREPTPAQQKIALQLMGMLAQGTGVSLTVNNTANANAKAEATQQTALVDNKFMDSLRANTDAAIAKSRGLKPGTMTALPEPEVVDAEVMIREQAPAEEAGHGGATEAGAHSPVGRRMEPRDLGDVVGRALQQGSAGSTGAGAAPTDHGPRAVIPPLGIPGGVRRPPPAVT